MIIKFGEKSYQVQDGAEHAKLPDGSCVRVLSDGVATLSNKNHKNIPAAVELPPEPVAPPVLDPPPGPAKRPLEGLSKEALIKAYSKIDDAEREHEKALAEGREVMIEIGTRLKAAGKGAIWTLPSGAQLTGSLDRQGVPTVRRRAAGVEAG